MRMMGKADAPADMPVSSYSASVQYAGVIYGKAPYFYRAVRQAIGDAAFFAAMKQYVTKYRWNEAPARGLVDLLAASGGEAKVRPLERHWLDETHGDEDLGTLDLNGMMSGLMGGAGGLGGLTGGGDMGEMQEVMKMLQAAGANLPGGGSMPAPTGTPGAPGASGQPDPDIGEILKMFGAGQ
jgi:hypothetical protein